MNDSEELWTAACQLLREQVSDAVWLSTFQDVRALDADPDGLHLVVPSATVRDRITTRYLPLVQDALRDAGSDQVELVLHIDLVELTDADRAFDGILADSTIASVVEPTTTTRFDDDAHEPPGINGNRQPAMTAAGLNPRYAFETFVKGQSNQFALAAAQRVAETPARSLQPAVHLRRGRAGQDPPAPRHRPLRQPELRDYQVRYVSTETLPQRVRRRHPHQRDRAVQASLPRDRRPAHRRHPVHGGQGGPPGGVLPHLQLAARRQQADRHLVRSHPGQHPHPGGSAAGPVQVGPDHGHPAAGPRDPPGHPPQQGRARPHGRAARRPRVHRHAHHEQHPRARRRPDPRHGLRQPQPLERHRPPRRAAPRRPLAGRSAAHRLDPHHHRGGRGVSTASRSSSCGARAANGPSSWPARSPCTSCAT